VRYSAVKNQFDLQFHARFLGSHLLFQPSAAGQEHGHVVPSCLERLNGFEENIEPLVFVFSISESEQTAKSLRKVASFSRYGIDRSQKAIQENGCMEIALTVYEAALRWKSLLQVVKDLINREGRRHKKNHATSCKCQPDLVAALP
jgi:hypothetical protein